jgi:phenylacetate-CoA ligase
MLVERADFADLDALAAHRQRLWERQRQYVLARSPLHRRIWSGAEPPLRLDAIAELPLVDKETLRDSQRVNPPFGDYLAAEETRIARVHRTSGTTGTAMNLALSRRDAHETAVVGGRAQSASGLGPGHRVVHCLNYRLWMGGVTDHTTLEATGATVVPFGVGDTQLLIRTIGELAITAISCTPSYPAVLERVIAEHFPKLEPRDLGLKLGLFGGEAGLDNPDFRRRLEATWGFQVRNANYGVSDVFSNFASQSATTTCISSRSMSCTPSSSSLAAGACSRGGKGSAASSCSPMSAANASRWCAFAPATSWCSPEPGERPAGALRRAFAWSGAATT